MDLITKIASPVLLYHSTFREVPSELGSNVHNVSPEMVEEHIMHLRRRVSIVSIDEMLRARRPRGLGAITFDDGYKCVIESTARILVDLGVPFTIFVNGAALEGKVFWRDKVRAIMREGLIAECEATFRHTRKISGLSFYKYTKDPRNDSRRVDEEIDRFLASRDIGVPSPHTMDSDRYFLRHPLVTYGNHSYHHYVLSSMPASAQREEILRTNRLLDALPGVHQSRVFSIPFGEPRDFNEATLDIIREMGYDGAVLSRQRINFRWRHRRGVRLIERFMPDDAPIAGQLRQIRCLVLR